MDKVRTPSRTKEEKIKLLQEQLADRERKAAEYSAKLQARIDIIAARGSTQDRKDDTRRKILLGAMLQNRIEKRKISRSKTDEWMSEFLTRDDDRILFGLAKIDNTEIAIIDSPDLHESGMAIDDSHLQLSDDIDNRN